MALSMTPYRPHDPYRPARPRAPRVARVAGGGMRWRYRISLVVLAMVAAFLLGLTAIWFVGLTPRAEPTPEAATDEVDSKAFSPHLVRFGMSSGQVKKLYPHLIPAVNETGHVVGTFALDGARHTVWFAVGDDGRERAFRIQYERMFRAAAEEQILADFGRRYGRTVFDGCAGRISQGDKTCHFRWLGEAGGEKNGVTVDVHTRTFRDLGRNLTQIRVIATDARFLPRGAPD